MRHYILSIQLAVKDMLHEWPLNAAIITSIAALLIPLMVLQGVRDGVIDGMLDELNADPASRELQPIGQGSFDRSFFSGLAQVPGVDYLIPATRYLAAPIELLPADSTAHNRIAAAMLPSTAGDPLLGLQIPPPQGRSTIVLTAALAEALKVLKGDRVNGSISRRDRDGSYESISFEFTVSGILAPELRGDKAALLSKDFVYASEFYREHVATDYFDTRGDHTIAPDDRIFPSFRLYVKRIEYVEAMRLWLVEHGIETVTRLDRIKLVQKLDKTFSRAVTLLALVGGTGMMAALACTFWLNIRRKRRELSVLLVLGMTPLYLNIVAQFQAVAIALLGCLFAAFVYMTSVDSVNRLFGESFGTVEVLTSFQFHSVLSITVLTVVVVMLAAAVAAGQILKIGPGEGLRDE